MQTQKSPTYLKAITLRDYSDVHSVKEDIKKGMILVLRVTPLAQKNVDELERLLKKFTTLQKMLMQILQDSEKRESLLLHLG
jgi:Protein of unknown function (DUF552).